MAKSALNSKRSGKKGSLFYVPGNNKYRLIAFFFPLLLFLNSITNNYNLDDELVTNNHRLTSKGISAIPEIFTSPYYQDDLGYAYEYRPIVLTTFAIEHELFGDNPIVSHLINVLLYSLTCLILFKLLVVLFEGYVSLISIGVTLMFIAHTTHSEVVCSIKNRDELLVLLFGLLSFNYAIKYVQNDSKWLFLSALMYLCGLLSKSTAISFALIIPIGMIMFFDLKLKKILPILISLIAPTFFAVTTGNFSTKLFMVASIFAIVCVMYLIINYEIIYTIIKQITIYFKGATVSPNKIEYTADGITLLTAGNFSQLRERLKPPDRVFELKLIIPFCILLLLYYWGWNNNYGALSIFSTVTVLIFMLFGRERTKWWGNAIFILLLVINKKFLGGDYQYHYGEILPRYLAFGFLFGNRKLILPYLIGYLLCLMLTDSYKEAFSVGLQLLVMISLTNKYVRVVVGLFLTYDILSIFPNINVQALLNLETTALGLIIILVLYLNKGYTTTLRLFALLLIVIFTAGIDKKNQSSLIKNSFDYIISEGDKINPSLVKKQDRPLHYTEVCLDPVDPVSTRLGTSFEILFHYLKKTVLPYPLAYYYGYKYLKPMEITDPIPIVSLVIHAILFAVALYLMHKDPLISFGLLIYLFSIATFSNYIQYIPGMVADRYLLVPTLGWSIVVVGVLRKFSDIADNAKNVTWSAIRPVAKYSFLALFILYSVLTFSRNFDWKDDLTLFRHDIAYVNESSQAHNLLALHLMQHASKETNVTTQQQLASEALTHFKRAIEIYPSFFNVAYDIGRVYSLLNKQDSAIIAFENALAIDSTTLPNLHLQLSELYINKGNKQKAIEHTERYINVKKNDYSGYSRLSYIYFTDKKFAESIEVNKRAMASIPNLIDPYINVAYTFREIKNTDSALHYLRLAEKIDPSNSNVQQGIKELTRNETFSR